MILLKQSANHPTDDTSVAGGPMSNVIIDDLSVGLWMPDLRGGSLPSTPTQTQYQCAYLHNTYSEEDPSPKYFTRVTLSYTLPDIINNRRIVVKSNGLEDGSSKFVRIYGKFYLIGGDVSYEDVVLSAGGTSVTTEIFTAIYRAELRNVSDGSLATAVWDVELSEEETGFSIGEIPSGQSYSTGEFRLGIPTSLGDQPTFANRRTQPDGLFVHTNWLNSRFVTQVDLPEPLYPGQHCAIYCRQVQRSGMPSFTPRLRITAGGGNVGATFDHIASATQTLHHIPVSHVGKAIFPFVDTPILGHKSAAATITESNTLGHSAAATPTFVESNLLGHSSKALPPQNKPLSAACMDPIAPPVSHRVLSPFLLRNGGNKMLAPLQGVSGTKERPGFAFQENPRSGLYYRNGEIWVTLNGSSSFPIRESKGGAELVRGVVPVEDPDGSRTVFTCPEPFADLAVFVSGSRVGAEYLTLSSPTFTLAWAPDPGEQILIDYTKEA